MESRAQDHGGVWLDVRGAAAHLACSTKRIYDLVAQRRVRFARDGRRLLFRVEWLDAMVMEAEHRAFRLPVPQDTEPDDSSPQVA
jgi:excisionase family DNA binding protein